MEKPMSVSKKDHVISDIVEKIAFANYLPLLTRSTSDSHEVAPPGYMLIEIEKLSYDYPHHCKQIAAFLSRRLEKPSVHVKLKVLKIMDHLIREGHANVRIALRKNDSSLKMASMYHGTPDPLLGTTLYENIRTSSRDLLELLFLPEKIQEDEKGVSDTRHPKQFLGALGSSNSSEGKYQGFGNSPIMKEETVADKVLNYFDKLSTTSDQNSKIIKEGIASSIGNYEAVSLPNIQQFAMPIAKPMPSLPPPPRVSAMKEHVPGKAGGGWEDSDEDEPKTSHHPSLLSEDSLETMDIMLENSAERDLVKQFCNQDKFPVTWCELTEMCTGCIKLSCPEVLRAIADELKPPAASTRALILLDALLNCELLASTRAVTEARQMLDQVLAKIVDDSSAPNLNRNKAAKIVQVISCRISISESVQNSIPLCS